MRVIARIVQQWSLIDGRPDPFCRAVFAFWQIDEGLQSDHSDAFRNRSRIVLRTLFGEGNHPETSWTSQLFMRLPQGCIWSCLRGLYDQTPHWRGGAIAWHARSRNRCGVPLIFWVRHYLFEPQRYGSLRLIHHSPKLIPFLIRRIWVHYPCGLSLRMTCCFEKQYFHWNFRIEERKWSWASDLLTCHSFWSPLVHDANWDGNRTSNP